MAAKLFQSEYEQAFKGDDLADPVIVDTSAQPTPYELPSLAATLKPGFFQLPANQLYQTEKSRSSMA
jgi:hypothetical protein